MAGAFPVSGQIDPQSFPFLLVDLHHNGATGSLKVEGPSYQKALYFRSGRILFGSSNDPRDQLGAILIETGTLTPEQLEEANSKVGPGSPLAKVLSETGFVSQRELGEAARAKVERILSDVVAYTAGSFEFEDGVLPKGAVDLKLSTERVLLAAVRRVTDRGFVLRHLQGLDVVLTHVAEMKGKLPEVEAEASELLARIDGRTTLKDAAAGTRLDEFDAAKLACTLVFLGILRRGRAGAAAAGSSAPFTLSDQPVEIDLLATAREAIADTAPPPVAPATVAPPPFEPPFAPPFEPTSPPLDDFRLASERQASEPQPSVPVPAADEPEMSIFVPEDVRPVGPPPVAPSAAEAEPIFFRDPEPPPAAEIPIGASSPPLQTAPDTAPYIPSRTPDLAIPRAPSGVGPSKREAREWKPAARSTATPPPARPEHSADLEIEASRQSASRPSKDDLAALDALLNSKGLEGPMQPLERPGADRWSSQLAGRQDRSGSLPRAVEGSPGRSRAAAIAILLAIAATGAFWYYLGRPQQGASASSPGSPAPAPTLAPENAQASPPVASSNGAPAAVIPTAAPPVATTAALPTPAPLAVAASPLPRASAPAGSGGLREARTLLASGNLPAAARAFAANLRAAPAGTATVQLLVACSGETVQKAVSSVSSPELYIVPVKYQGRDCYRLCWGLYSGADQAATAARALPDYFRKGGATPRVMSAAELQP